MTDKEKTALIEIVECDDGSHTLYRKDLDEHYHSVFGAVSESRHIFINAGYAFLSQHISEINVLEVGLGTGLNAFLTFVEAEKLKIKTNYTGIETIKLSPEIISKLNYAELIQSGMERDRFNLIHNCLWNTEVQLSPNFNLHKIESKIEDVSLSIEHFDLVYFDAFAPDIQAELWSETIFRKLYKAMNKGAVLVTYSCKGDVKRAMKSVGFKLEKLQGPKGKREFLRATK